MTPSRFTDDPYRDERRSYNSRPDSSRPGERERPPHSRRDSRDFRDTRYQHDSRDGRMSLDTRYGFPKDLRRDSEPSRPQVDTNFNASTSSRKPSLLSQSPSSAIEALTDELHVKRVPNAKSIATSTVAKPSTPIIPKAKDTTLQEAFKTAYKWGEKHSERLLLNIKKSRFEKEELQSRCEAEKIAAKASSYPPYNELADKYTSRDRMLEKQVKDVEEDYLRELEKLVAHFTTIVKPVGTNDQDPVIAKLEAKCEAISQLALKQAEQIEALLKDNIKTRETVTSLEKVVNSIESDHKQVKEKYNTLKSEHDTLRSKVRTWRDATQTLQSKQQDIEIENKSLSQQLQNFQASTEKQLGSSEAHLHELTKQSSVAAESMKTIENCLGERITGIETKLANIPDYDDIKEKLDDLDLATFNEMCEAWVSEDYNLKTQYEENSRRRRENLPSAPVRSSQEAEPLQSGPGNTSQPFKERTIEDVVNAKVAAAKEAINSEIRTYCEQRDDIHGELIDDALAQIQALKESMSNHSGLETRIQSRAANEITSAARAEQTRELETRVRSLEAWKTTNSAQVGQNQHQELAARIAWLEGKGVDHRVDRIDHDVGELSRRYEVLLGEVGHLVRREWVELRLQELLSNVGMNPTLITDIRELQRKIPGMELAIKTLDSQFQNLSTKQLAEHIVRMVAPNLEQRFASLEIRTNQLETRTHESDKIISHHAKRLLEANELLYTLIPGGKRPTSPGHMDEPSKKRKLDVVNGRHHTGSPLQPQQTTPQLQQPQYNDHSPNASS